jgi:hypothetical protein
VEGNPVSLRNPFIIEGVPSSIILVQMKGFLHVCRDSFMEFLDE